MILYGGEKIIALNIPSKRMIIDVCFVLELRILNWNLNLNPLFIKEEEFKI